MAIIITKPERATSRMRTAINELMYSISLDAQRDKQIEALLIERDQAIEEAYHFSYGVTNWDVNDRWYSNDTEHIAIEIIALKDRYSKQIQRCKVRHERFRLIVESLPNEDADVLLRAFCTDLEVDERDVKSVIKKHINKIEKYYQEDQKEIERQEQEANQLIESNTLVIKIVGDSEKRKKRLAKLQKNFR